MKRDEFDSQLNSLLLSAEKLSPEKDLPDLPYMELAPTDSDRNLSVSTKSTFAGG